MKKFNQKNSGFVGERADKFLCGVLDFSRSQIQKMIKNESILLNGSVFKSNSILRKDDVLSVLKVVKIISK